MINGPRFNPVLPKCDKHNLWDKYKKKEKETCREIIFIREIRKISLHLVD